MSWIMINFQFFEIDMFKLIEICEPGKWGG